MNPQLSTFVPLTQARNTLGDLASAVSQKKYVILTKAGKPKAALVDLKYLATLQNDVRKMYQKTFIDPKLLPFTRTFSDSELAEWAKEDAS